MEIQPLIISAGLVMGVLIGLTGMGGGALMTPFLILVGVRPSLAVGTDLFQMMLTKSFGAWQHHRQGTVNFRLVLLMAAGSLPGALVGVALLTVLREYFNVSIDTYLPHLLGGVLTLVGVVLLLRLTLVRWFWRYEEPRLGSSIGELVIWRKRYTLLPAVGAVIGLLVGLTSVGSGTLFIAFLTIMFPMSMRTIVGTDVFHSAILTAGAGLLHLAIGNVDLVLAGNILVGSIPGVLLGSRLTIRLPEKGLRVAVAVALMGVGLKLL